MIIFQSAKPFQLFFQNSIWRFWKPRVNRKPYGTTIRIWPSTAIPTLAPSRHNPMFNDGGKSVNFSFLYSASLASSLAPWGLNVGICIRKPLRMSKHFIEKWLESGFRCREPPSRLYVRLALTAYGHWKYFRLFSYDTIKVNGFLTTATLQSHKLNSKALPNMFSRECPGIKKLGYLLTQNNREKFFFDIWNDKQTSLPNLPRNLLESYQLTPSCVAETRLRDFKAKNRKTNEFQSIWNLSAISLILSFAF